MKEVSSLIKEVTEAAAVSSRSLNLHGKGIGRREKSRGEEVLKSCCTYHSFTVDACSMSSLSPLGGYICATTFCFGQLVDNVHIYNCRRQMQKLMLTCKLLFRLQANSHYRVLARRRVGRIYCGILVVWDRNFLLLPAVLLFLT